MQKTTRPESMRTGTTSLSSNPQKPYGNWYPIIYLGRLELRRRDAANPLRSRSYFSRLGYPDRRTGGRVAGRRLDSDRSGDHRNGDIGQQLHQRTAVPKAKCYGHCQRRARLPWRRFDQDFGLWSFGRRCRPDLNWLDLFSRRHFDRRKWDIGWWVFADWWDEWDKEKSASDLRSQGRRQSFSHFQF